MTVKPGPNDQEVIITAGINQPWLQPNIDADLPSGMCKLYARPDGTLYVVRVGNYTTPKGGDKMSETPQEGAQPDEGAEGAEEGAEEGGAEEGADGGSEAGS